MLIDECFFTLTSLGIVGIKVPESVLATVAATPLDVPFAVTAPGLVAAENIGSRIANAVVQGSTQITVACCEDSRSNKYSKSCEIPVIALIVTNRA